MRCWSASKTSSCSYGGQSIRLTPMEADIIAVLKSRMPFGVSHTEMVRTMLRMWGGGDPAETIASAVVRTISKARPKLRLVGLRVLPVYGRGYRLVRVGTDILEPQQERPA
jgi:DNA-binding winged helix-turn-helix (wHTH) protein